MGKTMGNAYFRLFNKALSQTIFGSTYITAVAAWAFAMTLAATYATVKISDAIVDMANTFRTERFSQMVSDFLQISILALGLKFAPKLIYASILQRVCRTQFVNYLSEYLQLGFVEFHKKTPGEMRYTIFLKAFASVTCSHLVIFEASSMLGTAGFSFIKCFESVNPYTASIFVLVPVLYISMVVYYIKYRLPYQTEYLKHQEKAATKLYDKLINYDVIKTYNLESAETEQFYNDMHGQMQAQIALGLFDSRILLTFDCMLIIPYMLLVFFVLKGNSTPQTRGLFKTTLLYITLTAQLKRIGREIASLMTYLNQIKFSDIESSPQDHAGATGRSLDRFCDTIEYRDVTLYYGDHPVISDINLLIAAGEKIAVVGPNGTGKSTFIKSLLGFTKFVGNILIDGQNTAELSWRSILRLISYVPQDDYTSDDTVMQNLKLGRADATDEDVINKAREFCAHEDFMALQNGYETQAGPRGNRLSGGQLQKISLVRAAVKDAPIFILDEATAAMDKSFENVLIKRLFERLADRTVIMIVHSHEYFPMFDRLLFLNNGKVEQAGHYDELLATNNNFRLFVK